MATITKAFKVTIPSVPNFITVGGDKLPIADFSDAELKAIGKAWTDELRNNAAEKRMQKEKDAAHSAEVAQTVF